MFTNYMKGLIKEEPDEDKQGKYKEKVARLKRQITEYVHVSQLTSLMNKMP